MAIDTKPNFSNNKFEQCVGDIMNLSGCTQIYGYFDIENAATLTICNNAGAGKVLTSDGTGVATWQNPSGDTYHGTVTSISAGTGMDFTEITTVGAISLGTPSPITSGSTNIVTGNTHYHEFSACTFVTGNQGIMVDENNHFYIDTSYVSDLYTPNLFSFSGVTSNQSIGILPSGQTMGIVYLTNSGTNPVSVNISTTPLGNDITPYQSIDVDPNEDVSLTINMRVSLTENKVIYINAADWTDVILNVEWAYINYKNADICVDNTVPVATTESTGIVQIGGGLCVDGEGVISVTGGTSGLEWTGSTNNGIATYVDSSKVCSEPNLRFSDDVLNVDNGSYKSGLGTNLLYFTRAAQNYINASSPDGSILFNTSGRTGTVNPALTLCPNNDVRMNARACIYANDSTSYQLLIHQASSGGNATISTCAASRKWFAGTRGNDGTYRIALDTNFSTINSELKVFPNGRLAVNYFQLCTGYAAGCVLTSDEFGCATWQTPPAGSSYTFNNGLTNTSGTVSLGGTLTSAVNINGNQALNVGTTTVLDSISLCSEATYIYGGADILGTGYGFVCLGIGCSELGRIFYNNSGCQSINLSNTGDIIVYNDSGLMKYSADYSSSGGADPRWIPDAAWVTGQTSGGGGITWAGTTANGVATYVNSSTVCSEPNLTFDGTNLVVGGKTCTSTLLVSTGAATGCVLTSDASGNATWQTPSGGGGSTPGGNNTEIQYNDNGSFSGSTLCYDDSNNTFGLLTAPTTTAILSIGKPDGYDYNSNYTYITFDNGNGFAGGYVSLCNANLTIGANVIKPAPDYYGYNRLYVGESGKDLILYNPSIIRNNPSIAPTERLDGEGDLYMEFGFGGLSMITIGADIPNNQTGILSRTGCIATQCSVQLNYSTTIAYFEGALALTTDNNHCSASFTFCGTMCGGNILGSVTCNTIYESSAGCVQLTVTGNPTNRALVVSLTNNYTTEDVQAVSTIRMTHIRSHI